MYVSFTKTLKIHFHRRIVNERYEYELHDISKIGTIIHEKHVAFSSKLPSNLALNPYKTVYYINVSLFLNQRQ